MPSSLKSLYRFDEFELDTFSRALVRNAVPVPISPKAFDLLFFLVLNPGRVIPKDELLKAVWPDSFVEESNLAQHISGLVFSNRKMSLKEAKGRRSGFCPFGF